MFMLAAAAVTGWLAAAAATESNGLDFAFNSSPSLWHFAKFMNESANGKPVYRNKVADGTFGNLFITYCPYSSNGKLYQHHFFNTRQINQGTTCISGKWNSSHYKSERPLPTNAKGEITVGRRLDLNHYVFYGTDAPEVMNCRPTTPESKEAIVGYTKRDELLKNCWLLGDCILQGEGLRPNTYQGYTVDAGNCYGVYPADGLKLSPAVHAHSCLLPTLSKAKQTKTEAFKLEYLKRMYGFTKLGNQKTHGRPVFRSVLADGEWGGMWVTYCPFTENGRQQERYFLTSGVVFDPLQAKCYGRNKWSADHYKADVPANLFDSAGELNPNATQDSATVRFHAADSPAVAECKSLAEDKNEEVANAASRVRLGDTQSLVECIKLGEKTRPNVYAAFTIADEGCFGYVPNHDIKLQETQAKRHGCIISARIPAAPEPTPQADGNPNPGDLDDEDDETPPQTPPQTTGGNTGIIIGGAFGGLAVLASGGVLAYVMLKKKSDAPDDEETSDWGLDRDGSFVNP